MATVVTTTYNSTTDTTALTITLASLGSSSTSVAGQESTAISNASDLYMDALVSGQITTGSATLTAGVIEVYVYGYVKHVSSTATYPNPLTGSNNAVTFVAETKQRLYLGDSIATNTTANTAYGIKPFGVAQFFGGIMPIKWGIVVVHNTGQNLNATAGNQYIHYQGIKYTST